MLIHVATARKILQVIHDFAYDVEHRQRVDVNILFPFPAGLIVGIDGIVCLLNIVSDIILLLPRQNLWRFRSDRKPNVVFLQLDKVHGIVLMHIGNLKQPAASDCLGVGFHVILLLDIDTVLAHPDFFGEEIQSNILAVEHDLDRFLGRRVGQPDAAAQLKAHRVLEAGQIVVGVSLQAKVAVAVHPHQRLLFIELDAVGFLVIV